MATSLLASCNVNKTWIGVALVERRGAVATGHGRRRRRGEEPRRPRRVAAGDVVPGVDDREIRRPLDFQRAMLDRKPGEQVRLRCAGQRLARAPV